MKGRGSVTKRITPQGAIRFDARFREGGRGSKQITRTFTTWAQANAFIGEQTESVRKGTYVRVEPAPLETVFTAWIADCKVNVELGNLRRSTMRGYASIVTHHLIPAFGGVGSDRVTPEHIHAWKKSCADAIKAGTLAPKTYNNAVGCLSSALAWAREAGFLAHQPLPRKLRSGKGGESRAIVEGAQIATLWYAATGQDQIILAFALFLGMRRGEIFGARWADFHWPTVAGGSGYLHVTQAFVQRELVAPKTAAGNRFVTVPPKLVDLVRAHQRARAPLALGKADAFIVRQDTGAPVDPDTWGREVWPGLREGAKLPPRLTLHGLRHSFASIMLAEGHDPKLVAEQMGHKDVGFLRKQYQHVLASQRAAAASTLNTAIPDGPAPSALRLLGKGL